MRRKIRKCRLCEGPILPEDKGKCPCVELRSSRAKAIAEHKAKLAARYVERSYKKYGPLCDNCEFAIEHWMGGKIWCIYGKKKVKKSCAQEGCKRWKLRS
ncbi:MAG: hypothetical protein AMS21_00650 [Gemmatimonas sp. SG8_38_2]|nr:MAG: hypothetical protein AMS21_00650 [Gemmatimonas sp. SG8_38_2]